MDTDEGVRRLKTTLAVLVGASSIFGIGNAIGLWGGKGLWAEGFHAGAALLVAGSISWSLILMDAIFEAKTWQRRLATVCLALVVGFAPMAAPFTGNTPEQPLLALWDIERALLIWGVIIGIPAWIFSGFSQKRSEPDTPLRGPPIAP